MRVAIKTLAAAFGALLAAAGAASAQDGSGCFSSTPLTKQLAADVLAASPVYYPGGAGVPTFIAADLSYMRDSIRDTDSTLFGAVLLVREGDQWRAIVPSEGQTSVGLFVSSAAPTVIVAAQSQTEGPAPGFTIIRSTDGLKGARCTEMAFPKALNNPTYAMETLELKSMQMDAKGRGALIASAEIDVETDAPKSTWWLYKTANGFKTLSKPKRIKAEPSAKPGVLSPVASPVPEFVARSLNDFVAAPH